MTNMHPILTAIAKAYDRYVAPLGLAYGMSPSFTCNLLVMFKLSDLEKTIVGAYVILPVAPTEAMLDTAGITRDTYAAMLDVAGREEGVEW